MSDIIHDFDIGPGGTFKTRAEALRGIGVGDYADFAARNKRHADVIRGNAYSVFGRGNCRVETMHPTGIRPLGEVSRIVVRVWRYG